MVDENKFISLISIEKKRDKREILKELSYQFETGKTYVITGESGAGKTTLLNIIKGYEKADSGTLKYHNCSKIEYMFQQELLFSNLTVYDNLLLKYAATNRSIESGCGPKFISVLTKLNIQDLKNKKLSFMSGGERQRVQIAQMMLSNPDVVLFDEPITQLDRDNIDAFVNIIQEQFHKQLRIIVSHQSIPGMVGDVVNLRLFEGRLYE